MPLTAQEERCVRIACQYLDRVHPGPRPWDLAPGPTLEDQHRSGRVPEVLVQNGEMDAAIEVKGLTGSDEDQLYESNLKYLFRFLAPPCGGHYTLNPCVNFRLPIDFRLMKHLRQGIARVASSMSVGDEAPVPVPRKAPLRWMGTAKWTEFYCSHCPNWNMPQWFRDSLDGIYWLVDDDEWEHEFQTEAGRQDFFQALSAALRPAREQGQTILKWVEEWELLRDDAGRNGVWIVAVTNAQDVPSVVEQRLTQMLLQGLQKFSDRRWARLHVLMLDNKRMILPHDLAREAVAALSANELSPVDLVLLADRGQTVELWSTESGRDSADALPRARRTPAALSGAARGITRAAEQLKVKKRPFAGRVEKGRTARSGDRI